MVETRHLNENFPVPFENSTMFKNAEVVWVYHGKTELGAEDVAANLASSGYYQYVLITSIVDQEIFTAVNFHCFRDKAMFTAGIFHSLLVLILYRGQ
jgi:hypothetical protein